MLEGNKTTLYWTDAIEWPPNGVRLFGRDYVDGASISALISNVWCVAYAVPRVVNGVSPSMEMMVSELSSRLATRNASIKKYSFKRMNYAFDLPDVPHGESSFLKMQVVRASTSQGQAHVISPFVRDESGTTFVRVIGGDRGPVETFLISSYISGPCWLVIEGARPAAQPSTWCTRELEVESPTAVKFIPCDNDMPVPPLKILEFNIQCTADLSPKINSATFRHHPSIRVDTLADSSPPISARFAVDDIQTEEAVIRNSVTRVSDWDPDIVVCHRFDADVMKPFMERGKELHLQILSRLGRVRGGRAFAGRIVCDVETVAGDLIKTPLRSHSLVDVCTSLFPTWAPPVPRTAALDMAWKIIQTLDALGLTLSIAVISGCLWQQTLAAKHSEQNDFMLMHQFSKFNFVLPDPKPRQREEAKKKPAYPGGRVITPDRGLKDGPIAVLDFVGMYPSIIVAHNICHTTRNNEKSTDQGILPRIISDLIKRRKAVKEAMKKTPTVQLNTQQQSLKLAGNQLYGCLGYSQSRFCDKVLAARITQYGRNALVAAEDVVVKKFGLGVLYGDSDSLMIYMGDCPIPEARKYAEKVVREINSELEGGMGMAIDKIFSVALFMSKKKYAAINGETNSCDIKGLELVRHDWCPIACDTARKFIELVLAKSDQSALSKCLVNGLNEMTNAATPISRFVINKCLSKDPTNYAKSQLSGNPHVRAALQNASRHYRSGDYVSYIICTGSDPEYTSAPRVSLSPGPQEIDRKWYVEHQLVPMLERICSAAVPQYGPTFVSQTLGLTNKRTAQDSGALDIAGTVLPELVRTDHKCETEQLFCLMKDDVLASCPEFVPQCPSKCQHKGIGQLLRNEDDLQCSKCKFQLDAKTLCDQFHSFLITADPLTVLRARSEVDQYWLAHTTANKRAARKCKNAPHAALRSSLCDLLDLFPPPIGTLSLKF
jgi:DNA polymerase alpha subunit A